MTQFAQRCSPFLAGAGLLGGVLLHEAFEDHERRDDCTFLTALSSSVLLISVSFSTVEGYNDDYNCGNDDYNGDNGFF